MQHVARMLSDKECLGAAKAAIERLEQGGRCSREQLFNNPQTATGRSVQWQFRVLKNLIGMQLIERCNDAGVPVAKNNPRTRYQKIAGASLSELLSDDVATSRLIWGHVTPDEAADKEPPGQRLVLAEQPSDDATYQEVRQALEELQQAMLLIAREVAALRDAAQQWRDEMQKMVKLWS